MSGIVNGVYLLIDEEEHFLGRTNDILQSPYAEEFAGGGISLGAILMDIVQDIISSHAGNHRAIVIEVRE